MGRKSSVRTGEFKYGLFGCFNDCGLCIITFFLPCYTFGKNAEAVGDSCLLCGLGMLCGLGFILGPFVRTQIRKRQGIHGSFIGDFFIWFFCCLCALVQEGQEVRGQNFIRGQTVERE